MPHEPVASQVAVGAHARVGELAGQLAGGGEVAERADRGRAAAAHRVGRAARGAQLVGHAATPLSTEARSSSPVNRISAPIVVARCMLPTGGTGSP